MRLTINEIEETARMLMNKHGLHDWKFKWDKTKRRLGACFYQSKTITLSILTNPQRDKYQVINTILHEIAHALVGSHNGHNIVWKTKAREIGCTDDTYEKNHDDISLVKSIMKYVGTCSCGKKHHKDRLSKQFRYKCGTCYSIIDFKLK